MPAAGTIEAFFGNGKRMMDWARSCQSRHAGGTCCSRYAVLPGYNTPTTVPHVPRTGPTVIGWDEVFISFGLGLCTEVVTGRRIVMRRAALFSLVLAYEGISLIHTSTFIDTSTIESANTASSHDNWCEDVWASYTPPNVCQAACVPSSCARRSRK